MENLQRIAMLIDADQAQLEKLEITMREIATRGRIILKRAYGNWKDEKLKNWEDKLNSLAIKAVQQFDYTKKHNYTDMVLIIDAMELLNLHLYDMFVLVAGDSDYTPLAIRLRESGATVIGVGSKRVKEAFRNSCDEFIYVENLEETEMKKKSATKDISMDSTAAKQIDSAYLETPAGTIESAVCAGVKKSTKGKEKELNEVHELLKVAAEKWTEEDGFVNVSSAGAYIKRAKSDFDAKNFGYKNLPELISAFPKLYETKQYEIRGKGKTKTTLINAYRVK